MKTKKLTKKKAAAILAVIALISVALGATFAWSDYNQHKSNEFNGRGYKHDVRLVEDFEEVDDWRIEDNPVKKEIRVANVGSVSDGYGPVLVRIQLKEYMEIGELEYTMTDKRYMIDTDGEFIIFPAETAALAAYPGHNAAHLTDVVTGDTGWFIETREKDPNGQYGKYVATDVVIDMSAATPIIPGSVRAPDDARDRHHEPDNDECDYPLHLWDIVGELPTSQYVQWILGDNVVAMSEWDGNQGKHWVYDDLYGTGWVYWVDFLNPGETTLNFLEQVALIRQPDGPFYYAIHTDMESLSKDELGLWVDMPKEIITLFSGVGTAFELPTGDGTESNPYIIRTDKQMAWLAEVVNADADDTISGVGKFADKYWKMGNDIDLSAYGESWNDGKGWVPIGDVDNPFRGNFEGSGHKISKLYVNDETLNYAGLFGLVEGIAITNLGVTSVNINGHEKVGGLVGQKRKGNLNNCYIIGSIRGKGNYVGGVVGVLESALVFNSYSMCSVSGINSVGGIVGSVNGTMIDAIVTNSYVVGTVSGVSNVGGIAGSVSHGNVSSCAALNSSVKSYTSNVGRVIGYIDNLGVLVNNAAFSSVNTCGGIPFPTPATIYNVHYNLNGVDLDTADILADGSLGGRFTSLSWDTENGKLPTLANLVGQDGTIPDYIN